MKDQTITLVRKGDDRHDVYDTLHLVLEALEASDVIEILSCVVKDDDYEATWQA